MGPKAVPEAPPGRLVSRRAFLGWCAGALAALVAACKGGGRGGEARPEPFEVAVEGKQPVEGLEARGLTLVWSEAAGAEAYDVEVDGVLVAEDLTKQRLEVKPGDGQVGLREGLNSWRVRARNEAGRRWSDPGAFEVQPAGVIRSRSFDHEDDGEIRLAAPASGAAMVVGRRFAFGEGGKGLALRCSGTGNAQAYADHLQLPVADCWLRLALRPQSWEEDDIPVNLARIRASAATADEQIIWRTGREVRSTSVPPGFPLPAAGWLQVQLGILADGRVELWAFDGHREALVGRGVNRGLAGRGKDLVSLGNDAPADVAPCELWLDELAVGERRLPWARAIADHAPVRPQRVDPRALPPAFSFVFGSDIRPSRAPYRGGALEAAAAAQPDFVINLGDFGYPDAEAYRQSKQGYLALWMDLLREEQMSRLFRKPWIYVTSDHDMGADNVDVLSVAPFASEAFAMWQNNDRSADGVGRYGSLAFDGGRVLLIWVDTISFRSPIQRPDSPQKTILGAEQKRWLLKLLAESPAALIIIASQTAFGHRMLSGWVNYPTERREVFQACRGARGAVRWLTGDHHTARWARMGRKVAEWGAAPLGDHAHPWIAPGELVDEAVCIGAGLSTTIEALKAQTSFGRVAIDTIAKTATFEVRDNRGQVRVDSSGFRMAETIAYG